MATITASGGAQTYDPVTQKFTPFTPTPVTQPVGGAQTGADPSKIGQAGYDVYGNKAVSAQLPGSPAGLSGAPAAPSGNPTIASLYGSENTADQGVDSSVGVYKDIANTPVDEAGIRTRVMNNLQAEIDATNKVYAEKLRQAHIAGEGRLGSNAAISARRGLLGSDFGTAANDTVVNDNNQVYGGIGQEQAAAIAGITDKGAALAQQEIAAKNQAKQQGAQDYISFLSQQTTRKDTRTSTAAQNALAAGIDLSKLSSEQVQGIADSYSIDPKALIAAFSTAKASYKPVSLTAGAPAYAFNPKTGAYEKVQGTGVSDAVSQAIAEGRLDPSQVTRYNIQSISDTLTTDPAHNFITGKQTLQNSTSYTKDPFGNIVPVQRFPNAPVAGKTGIPSSGGSSGGSVTSFPKADAASLQKQQEYADSTQRAFNTANANLKALIPFMTTAGVNTGSNIPLINSLQNRVKAGLADPGSIAAFGAALAGLRAEYAQVLSRGGEVTEGQRAQATSLIPDNLTPVQLQQVADRLNIEGTNAVKEAQNQVQAIKDRVNKVSPVANQVSLPGAGVNLKDPKTGEVRSFTGLSPADLKDALSKGYVQQ